MANDARVVVLIPGSNPGEAKKAEQIQAKFNALIEAGDPKKALALLKVAKDFVVANKLGIHARPAAMFVKVANQFDADVFVEKDGERVNGKSIMGLMTLEASQGVRIRVTATGDDAEQVLNEIQELIDNRFYED